MKRIFIFSVCLSILCAQPVHAELKVVTTLSSFADLVKTIGADQVEVKSIASPRFNPHSIEPKPSDVFKLKQADLFVHSGLDLEAWRDPLVQASGRTDFKAGGDAQLDLSAGVQLLEIPQGQPSRAAGDIHLFGNPHFWLSPENGLVMARNISNKLAQMDRAHAELFESNLKQFEIKLGAKIIRWREDLAPFRGTQLIGYHNEWVYLIEFLGLNMTQFIEPKPGIPPTPRHIEELVQFVKERKVPAILQASFYSKDAAETLQQLSGARLTIVCQNVGELPEASDYISMLDYDISMILGSLKHA